MSKSFAEIGARYGQLTVIARLPDNEKGWGYVECRCDCGNLRKARTVYLKYGMTKKCEACTRAVRIEVLTSHRFTGALDPQERVLRRSFQGYRSNARIAKREFALDFSVFRTLVRSPCHYCGVKPDPFGGIDRIVSSQGYVASNVVPACSTCNYAKRDMSTGEFLEWVRRAYEHQYGSPPIDYQ